MDLGGPYITLNDLKNNITEIERKIKRFFFYNLHVLAKSIQQILVKTDEFEKEVHEIKLKRTTISPLPLKCWN